MTEQATELGEHSKEQAGNSGKPIQESSIFSYYRDDSKETGGLKVKWTIRVADGAEVGRLDDRQAKAIWELLQWARRHHRI